MVGSPEILADGTLSQTPEFSHRCLTASRTARRVGERAHAPTSWAEGVNSLGPWSVEHMRWTSVLHSSYVLSVDCRGTPLNLMEVTD